MEELFGGLIGGTGWGIGIGIAVGAVTLLRGRVKPVTKGVVKGYLRAREGVAALGERLQDQVAEARSEMATGASLAPAEESTVTTTVSFEPATSSIVVAHSSTPVDQEMLHAEETASRRTRKRTTAMAEADGASELA